MLQKVRCDKPTSRCARVGEELHGPYWYLYWKNDGRTKSRYVGKESLSEPGGSVHPFCLLQKQMKRWRRTRAASCGASNAPPPRRIGGRGGQGRPQRHTCRPLQAPIRLRQSVGRRRPALRPGRGLWRCRIPSGIGVRDRSASAAIFCRYNQISIFKICTSFE